MHKLLLALFVLLFLILPSATRAQNPLDLSSLKIGIWPEFDKPSVLVIYQATLSSSTAYPASVAFRIPATAGEPNAVAALQADGSLINITYSRNVSGQWAVISFTTSTPEVQLEYYDPSLSKNGEARHFSYTWPGDYAVSQLTIQVQQPTGTTNMRISPSLGSGAVGTDNLTYFTQNIGSITDGQNFQITIDYQKSDDVLSVETLPIESSAPIPQGTSIDLNVLPWLPWALGIVGAVLIVGGVIWFWQTGQQRPALRPRRQRSRKTSNEPELSPGDGEEAIYCSQCGKRAMPGDQFCRSCGSQIHAR
jgi:hypothetical protein